MANPDSRRFCRRCGARLAPAGGPAAVPRPKPPASVRPDRRLPVVLSALAGVLVVGVTAGIVSRGGDGQPPSGPAAPVPPTTAVTVEAPAALRDPARVDPATITAAASSVLPPENGFSYGIRNTLDDNPSTAWNDGAPGSGAGEKLTYRFAGPVQLVGIRVVNGFASTPELFQQNARISGGVVVTDGGRFPFSLADVADRQALTMDFGRTSSVVIEVTSTYSGTHFEDLALTEVEFFVRPE